MREFLIVFTCFWGVIFLFSPLLARRIKKIFLSQGVRMRASPYFAFVNISSFWSEAYSLNKVSQNAEITLYLRLIRVWDIVLIVLFLAIFTVE